MIKRCSCVGMVGWLLLQASGAAARPAYCPATTPTACGAAAIGDPLITLHGNPPRIIGLRESTRTYYVFSNALTGATSSTELGDIAVVPSNPVETVVIGNVDGGFNGVRRLNACGGLVSPMFGVFPSSWPSPWVPVSHGGTNNRGLVFDPLDAELFSPGQPMPFLNDSTLYGPIFSFPPAGGWASLFAASGTLANPTVHGAVAADELGNLYLGQTSGSTLTKIPATGLMNNAPVESALGWPPFSAIHDMVHDGNHHLFVTDYDSTPHGKVWRFNLLTNTAELWTDNLGPAFGSVPLNELYGITMDAWGDLWVVEQYSFESNRAGLIKISGRTGQVLDYFTMPGTLDGEPLAGAQPFGIALYGVNLPAVRERCNGTCAAWEVADCFGACIPADTVGDAFCDDGPHVSLNCYAREFDGGDCSPCASWESLDCNGNCAPKGWIGDNICDDGGWWYGGNAISFDCPAFRFDEATCRSCTTDETLDCNGNCAPINWLGDSICDDGGYTYFGVPIDLDCAEYDFDQLTCQ